MPLITRVLVAVDGSPHSRKAVEMAVEICLRHGCHLTVLHVIQQPSYVLAAAGIPPTALRDYYSEARREAEKVVSGAVGMAEKAGLRVDSEILENAPSIVQAITEYAETNGFDLIVVGTRGLSGFKKLLLGSVAGGVVSHAHCPVLVVR